MSLVKVTSTSELFQVTHFAITGSLTRILDRKVSLISYVVDLHHGARNYSMLYLLSKFYVTLICIITLGALRKGT